MNTKLIHEGSQFRFVHFESLLPTLASWRFPNQYQYLTSAEPQVNPPPKASSISSFAALDATIAHRDVQCQRHRGGGGIAMLADREAPPDPSDMLQFLGGRGDDAGVGLMRNQPVDIGFVELLACRVSSTMRPSVFTATLNTSLPCISMKALPSCMRS